MGTDAEDAAGAGTPGDLLLVCRVGTRRVTLPVADVVEVMRRLPVAPVAGTPGFVSGAAVIRGATVPVLDVAVLLGGEAGAEPDRLVTVRVGGRVVALAVDAVEGTTVLATDRAALPPLLDGARSGAVAALGALDHELLVVLDGAGLEPVTPALAGGPVGP